MKRRVFLLASAMVAASSRLLAKLNPTPSQVEGPFYPVEPIPLNNDLIHYGGGTARGEQLALNGVVKTADGTPLANALIEIWQCDASGRYRHPRASGKTKFDKYFAGFGAMTTSAAGEYQFSTLMPVPYTGRPPHIHVKIHRQNSVVLTSQLYLQGQEQEPGISGVFSSVFGDRTRLVIDPISSGANRRQAQFDFIVDA